MNQEDPLLVAQQAELSQILRSGIWLHLIQTFDWTIRRSGYAQRVFSTQQFVGGIRQWTYSDVTLIQAALELLYATQGQVRMSELAAHCCLSLRQFERRFKQRMGVSPKVFARLLRFEALRNSLILDPASGLTDVASRFGYQDQAHLIHEFKIWAGCTPCMFMTLASQRRNSKCFHTPDTRTYTPSSLV